MNAAQASGRIKITKVPQGDAPIEIKRMWVGLVLPCSPICAPFAVDQDLRRVINRKRIAVPKEKVVLVPQGEALRILGQKHPEAKQWWTEHRFPLPPPNNNFVFRFSEFEILEGITVLEEAPAILLVWDVMDRIWWPSSRE